MSAPMKTESGSTENPCISEQLDPKSPNFDPRKALYERTLPLPVPEAKQFNNLAEFENFLSGKDALSRQKNKTQKEKTSSGVLAVRAAAQAKEADRKAAITAKYGGPSERSAAQERRKQPNYSTVFTKMEGFTEGPLSLLRRCVEEKLRVHVVTRAAVAVRSRCRGYLIAFDKHFNMALMDVDEKLIRPIIKKKVGEDTSSSKDHRGQDNSVRVPDKYSARLKDKHSGNDHGSASVSSTDLRKKLKHIPSQKTTKTKVVDNERSGRCISDKDYCGSKSDSERMQSTSDARVASESDILKSTSASKSDSESKHSSSNRSKSNLRLPDGKCSGSSSGSKHSVKKQFTPFWPLYIKWTESRCYADYEIVDRHVNQLFIRGDNVVSVSIAD